MNWQGDERRKFERAEFPCKIIIGSPIRLLVSHTENISEGGIRVFLEEKLSNYIIVGLEIYFEKDKPIKCKGKIMWVKEAINPIERKPVMYETGIQFSDISSCDREYIRKFIGTVKGPGKEQA